MLQRVDEASVTVQDEVVGAIGRGLLVLVGIEREDDKPRADRLLARLLAYRVFPDADGRMNLDLVEVGGDLLLVPQFTLAADTRKGNRAGFSSAAAPELGAELFGYLAERARSLHPTVATGRFGAEMRVSLINNGPVTFWLQS